MLASVPHLAESRRVAPPRAPRPAKQIALVSRASARDDHRARHGA
jgi:hypothetical protein